MLHEMKTWPLFFEPVLRGEKRFEIRKDDRNPRFEVGDNLWLREWIPEDAGREAYYTGRTVVAKVTYVLRDAPHFGLQPGFCIMSLETE